MTSSNEENEWEEELEKIHEEQNDVEYEIFKISNKLMSPIFEKRRKITRNINRFWPSVIEHSELLAEYIRYRDLELLDNLKDIYVERQDENPRNFSITFEFNPNDYLETLILKKDFKYNEPSEKQIEEAEKQGIDAPEPNYTSEPVPIKWKKNKNLTIPGPDTSDTSFFKFFDFVGSGSGDYKQGETVALTITEEIYPHALKFISTPNEIEDEYDLEEEEEEGEDAEEGEGDEEGEDDDGDEEAEAEEEADDGDDGDDGEEHETGDEPSSKRAKLE